MARRSALCRLLLAALLLAAVPCSLWAAAAPRELLAQGRVDEVIRALNGQSSAEAENLLGRAYFALGHWDDAVHHCDRAVRLNSNSAEYQLWLGRAYGEKANSAGALSAYGLAKKSVAAFEAAHQLDRRNPAIARDLGEYYASAPGMVGGGSGKALALANEVAAENPSLAAWIRAITASHGGNQEEADRQYQESMRADHDSAATLLEYARYLKGRKQWERFQQLVERAMQSPRLRPEDRYDAAEMLLRTERNLPEAARQLRQYIQGGRFSEDAPLFRAHYLLGEVLQKSGDASQAAAEYRAALGLASGYRPAQDALHRMGQR